MFLADFSVPIYLLQDKVSAVRCAATLVIAKMLRTLEPELSGFLVADLDTKVCSSFFSTSAFLNNSYFF
jgi:hypothetical protein